MIVVSNTSPLNNLAAINQLKLLQILYGNVTIPEAVYQELTTVPVAGTTEVQTLPWIKKQQVTNLDLVEVLSLEIDRGEAQAIALGVELNAQLLLIDERLGRIVATRLGLRFTGVLGILLEAKHQGLITQIKPLLNDLRRSGFWVSEPLYNRVVNLAGE